MATPASPAGGTPSTGGVSAIPSNPLLNELTGTMKKYLGFDLDLNFFASALNPEIDAKAKRDAATAQRYVKSDSFFRSSLASRGLGVLAAALENMGDRQTGVLRALMKKGADYLESFGTYFYGHSLKEEKSELGDLKSGSLPPEYVKIAEMDVAWLKRVSELTAATSAGNMPAIEEQVAAEGKVNWMARELALHGPEKKPEPSVPFRERVADMAEVVDEGINAVLTPVNQELERHLAGVMARNEARRQRNQARGPSGSLFVKAWKWLAKP